MAAADSAPHDAQEVDVRLVARDCEDAQMLEVPCGLEDFGLVRVPVAHGLAEPCRTILEAASLAGFLAGLVLEGAVDVLARHLDAKQAVGTERKIPHG